MAEFPPAAAGFREAVPGIGAAVEFRGEITVSLPKESVPAAAEWLRAHGFSLLLDISGVDYYGEEPRFEVVYEFYNLESGDHLRLKARVSEDDLVVPTLSHIYPGAEWHEREAYDMYGIRFAGHPDLRRILMWEGYPYFPLRKDFPLEGKTSDAPGVAFTRPVPLEGGPFVTATHPKDEKDAYATVREPHARPPKS
jgi:NADH-quinone oxidoreductase subunit C